MTKSVIVLLVILVLCLIIYWRIRCNFKFLKTPSVCLVTGGVKTGKSLLCVYLATKDFIKRHRKWHFCKKWLHKDDEEPLFYTNVEINFGFWHKKLNKCVRLIALEHLNRDLRFNYKSVIYIQECSLLADNMDFNNKIRNVDLSLFNKLIAHETKGGVTYYDTQSVYDSHYSIKRVCSTYYFIQKNLNLLLFHVLYVREMINTENGVNNFTDDVDLTTRKVLIPFWYHHRYDRYYFSYLTDNLDKDYDNIKVKKELVSFNPLYIERAYKEKKQKPVNVVADNVIVEKPTFTELCEKEKK